MAKPHEGIEKTVEAGMERAAGAFMKEVVMLGTARVMEEKRDLATENIDTTPVKNKEKKYKAKGKQVEIRRIEIKMQCTLQENNKGTNRTKRRVS